MTTDTNDPLPAGTALGRAVLELDRHAAGFGWDQPTRLYALVDDATLWEADPSLATRLGLGEGRQGALTPIEQDELPRQTPLDEFLATIAWPEAVDGCAIVTETVMLPPAAEAQLPEDGSAEDLAAFVAGHPERQEVRMTVAVLRAGEHQAAIRLRDRDTEQEVLTGPDLVPRLAEALDATLR